MSSVALTTAQHDAVPTATERRPAAAPRRRTTRDPVVLMYHGFSTVRRDDDPQNLFVTDHDLRAQLSYLLGRGWTPLTLTDYLAVRAGGRRPRRSFLVTIDDGLDSVAGIAAPILAELGVPAVAFVPSALMGDTARWLPEPADAAILDRHAVAALGAAGIEIGGHGADHRDLRQLSADELFRQTSTVRADLARATGYAPRAFAYPYGLFDDAARRAVAAAGYDVAFSVFDDAGTFAISRVDVNATDTIASLRVKLVPGYRYLWRLTSVVRPVRRVVRRLVTRRTNGKQRGPSWA